MRSKFQIHFHSSKHFFVIIFLAVWLSISAGCSISLVFLTEFYSILVAFITFMSASLFASIIGAISVNLYPTKIRAMATCFIFMFGRIGGLAGSNLIGVFLENSCSSIFYVFSALTISKLSSHNLNTGALDSSLFLLQVVL